MRDDAVVDALTDEIIDGHDGDELRHIPVGGGEGEHARGNAKLRVVEQDLDLDGDCLDGRIDDFHPGVEPPRLAQVHRYRIRHRALVTQGYCEVFMLPTIDPDHNAGQPGQRPAEGKLFTQTIRRQHEDIHCFRLFCEADFVRVTSSAFGHARRTIQHSRVVHRRDHDARLVVVDHLDHYCANRQGVVRTLQLCRIDRQFRDGSVNVDVIEADHPRIGDRTQPGYADVVDVRETLELGFHL